MNVLEIIRNNRKNIILLAVSIITYTLIIFAVMSFCSIDSISTTLKKIIQNAFYIIMFLGTILLMKISPKPFLDFGFFKNKLFKQILIGLAIGLGNMLIMFIFRKLPQLPQNTLYVILSQILVGLSEEAFFRGFILTSLNEITKSKDLSIFISALFFALCHLSVYSSIVQLIPIFLMGIFMAVLRTEFKDSIGIISLAVGHALFNIF